MKKVIFRKFEIVPLLRHCAPFQLPRVIEGGVGVNDSREFEFYPGVALAARGGWALHQGQVV